VFSLDDTGLLTSVLQGGGLEGVRVEHVETAMQFSSLEDWWERMLQLAGPLAIALACMEPGAGRRSKRGRSTPGRKRHVATETRSCSPPAC
jgi:hypothetical protein